MKYLTSFEPKKVTYRSASKFPSMYFRYPIYDKVEVYDLKNSNDFHRDIYFLLSKYFNPKNILMVFYQNYYMNEKGECIGSRLSTLGTGEIIKEETISGGLENRIYDSIHGVFKNFRENELRQNYTSKFLVVCYKKGRKVPSFKVFYGPPGLGVNELKKIAGFSESGSSFNKSLFSFYPNLIK